MPIYEYKCKKCGHGFEHLARTLNASAPNCPKCNAKSPEKQLSAFYAAASQAIKPCDGGQCPVAGAEARCPSHSCASTGCPL